MKRGLYRLSDSFLGECARVHEDAGDAFPFLRRDLYEALGFNPPYDDLPMQDSQQQPVAA
ncbi:MAG: hypothetical protein V4521_09025 [Pseudomonadota bacterium]